MVVFNFPFLRLHFSLLRFSIMNFDVKMWVIVVNVTYKYKMVEFV